ncbi:MAG: glycosyltransferase family 4 protein [Bdellovibrionia bacterium]
MKLLYLAADFPYPSLSHAAARTQAMLKAWTEMGWDITFVCFPRKKPDLKACPFPQLREHIRPVIAHRAFFERLRGYLKSYHHNIIGSRAVDETLKIASVEGPFDLVLAEELAPARVALEMKKRAPATAKKFVYVAHNYEADLYSQISNSWLARVRLGWLRGFEKRVLDEMDGTFAFSEIMREQFARMQPRSRLFTTSACFELSRVRFEENRSARNEAIFVGALHYHPNVDGLVWFSSEVWKLLGNTKPKIIVAGSGPGPFVRQICSQNGFELVDTPPDMGEVLERARVEIVPLRKGSGVRGKILEAMAAGIPVISTTLGAEGLPVSHGLNILLADGPAEFAEKIREVMGSPDLTHKLGREGRLLAERFDGEKVARQLAQDLSVILT